MQSKCSHKNVNENVRHLPLLEIVAIFPRKYDIQFE